MLVWHCGLSVKSLLRKRGERKRFIRGIVGFGGRWLFRVGSGVDGVVLHRHSRWRWSCLGRVAFLLGIV